MNKIKITNKVCHFYILINKKKFFCIENWIYFKKFNLISMLIIIILKLYNFLKFSINSKNKL